MRRLLLKSFLFLFLILFISTFSHAQGTTGSITGIVQDRAGKAVPGANVTAKDKETGIEKTTQTGPDGIYFLTQLRPSTYDLTSRLEGVGTQVQEGIVVNVGSRITINMVLIPGAQEAIIVKATPLIETTQSHVGTIVTEEQIADLPLNGRNYIELTYLTPGNSPGDPYDPTKGRVLQVSTAGDIGRGGNVIVDGGDNNDDVVGGPLQNFSQDAIAEFQVLTNRFSAEYGRTGAGVVNVVTKTGTNEIHGGGFLFYRTDNLQAEDPIAKSKPPFDREQFGGTLGGPIMKDKAFWFASFEYANEDGVVNAGERVPDTGEVRNILGPTPLNDLLFTARTDWRLNDKNDMFGRYSYQKNDSLELPSPLAPVAAVSNFQIPENKFHSAVWGWTNLISGTKVNDLRVAEVNFFNFIGPNGDPPDLVFPSIETGANFRIPQRTRLNRFQVKDDFTWTKDDHLFKFGAEWQRIDSDALFDLYGSGPVYLAEDSATADRNGDGVINDNDIRVAAAVRNAAPGDSIPSVGNLDNNFFGFYFQDDWRIRENITLNLGLRYELDTQTNGANSFNETERIVFSPGERHDDKNNFGPRAGLVWDVGNNGKMVVRGGYGLYYNRIITEVELLERLLNNKALPLQIFLGPCLLENPFCGQAGAIATGVITLANDLENPQVHQFNAGVQRALWEDLTVSVDYVGARGSKFLVGREVNIPRPGSGAPPVNPNISDFVREIESIATSSYDGLLVSANKRFGGNVQFQVAYTLARAENWANDDHGVVFRQLLSDRAFPEKDKGRAEYLDTHRLVINGTYELPQDFRISGLFTYASGVPMEIRAPFDFTGDGVINDRFPLAPRNAGGREIQTGAELNALINEFNTSTDPNIVAMRQICNCVLPLVDPNTKFTDNFINLDLRFSKLFHFQQYTVEPILELFNVFNITNIRGSFVNTLAGFNNFINSPNFGKPVRTAGGAFGSGGPFAVQLAVKVKF